MLTLSQDDFFQAVKSGNLEKVKDLVGKDPSLVNAKHKTGATVILAALYAGQTEIARFLGEKKPHLDVFEAASLGNRVRLEALLRQDPGLARSFSEEGFTALQLAAYMGQGEAVDLLLKRGAEINAVAKNPLGFTALTGAVNNGHLQIAETLISRGANVNHRYEGGFSPLMNAAENGNLKLVQLLLKHGADPNAQMSDGKTALSYAEEKGHSEVAGLLRSKMA